MNECRVYIAPETFFPLMGGSERQAFLQSAYLRAQGMETTIITLHFQRESLVSEALDGVPILRVGGRILAWHDRLPGVLRRTCYLLALCAFGWQLWRRRHTYDILHVFQLSLFTLPALLVCRLTRKPLLVSVRNDVPPFGGEKPARSWNGLEGLARLGKPALRFIDHQLRLAGAWLVVLSTRMCERLECYSLTGAALRILPNGVDITNFTSQPEQEAEPFTVVCVAQFRYQKGIDVLLRAWGLLVEQLPQAHLLLVGDGPLFVQMQHLAVALGISGSVEFAGQCANVAQYYQRGSVAVLPSRWEGMPNALLEAMACGRACVATRVSGSEDLLEREKYGLLVEPEDVDALAEALWLLLSEPDLARRYGQAARQHIEQHYTLQMIMEQHKKLYEQLLARFRQDHTLEKHIKVASLG